MAQRYTQTSDDFAKRFVIKDDTLTTWKVVDTETSKEYGGLARHAAEKKADELNESVIYEEKLTGESEGEGQIQ